MGIWEQNFQKNKEVTGESSSSVIGLVWTSSHWFLTGQMFLVSENVLFWVLLNHAPTSTQLHPPPPNSFQPSPSSIQLHPAHLSFHPVLSTLLEPKYCTYLDNFPKFRPENWKLYILTENWHITYLGGADSKFGLRFWNSGPKIHFWVNLGQKSQSCSFCLKIGTQGVWNMLIRIPTLVFWISKPKFIFG